jgi:tRNA 5-methylaminomethyl-2-thiouridine biosynthesis bifunctional protein
LLPDLQLSLNRIRGQITQLPVAPAKTLNRTVICHEGYLSPAKNGQLCFGATYDLTSTTNHISQEDHEKNWQQLQHHLPALAEQLNFDTERLSGRSAFRCTSNDYLPVIGPAPNAEQFCQDYQLLSTNRKAYIPRRGCFQPGLYLNIGHGSRGLTSTPLAATLITAMLEGQNLPVAREMLKALSPARFLVKQLIRKNR